MSSAALPGCCGGGLGAKTGLITSWAALKELKIPSCELKLHTPCVEIRGMVVNCQDDTCVVFNPQPGKIAMLCMC